MTASEAAATTSRALAKQTHRARPSLSCRRGCSSCSYNARRTRQAVCIPHRCSRRQGSSGPSVSGCQLGPRRATPLIMSATCTPTDMPCTVHPDLLSLVGLCLAAPLINTTYLPTDDARGRSDTPCTRGLTVTAAARRCPRGSVRRRRRHRGSTPASAIKALLISRRRAPMAAASSLRRDATDSVVIPMQLLQ